MSRATSLTVIAIGAIFAFAVTASPGFLNLQIVGWILMATGAAGLLIERRSRDWLRRTIIVRGAPVPARRSRRGQTQIGTSAPAARPAGDQPTQPTRSAERETIEEYIEQ